MSFKGFLYFLTHNLVVRILTNKFFIATVVFALWITIFSPNNIFVWIEGLKEVSKHNAQIDAYKEEIKRAEDEFNLLRSNRDSIEKFARETYLFHAPDEEIFIVDPEED